jgi:pyruvate-formate lyase
LVKVAGYSARFVDLTDEEKDEIIARTSQRLH